MIIPQSTFLLTATIINISLFVVSMINLLRRRHIINVLAALALVSLLCIELSKYSLFLNLSYTSHWLGVGVAILPLFWFIFGIALLPSKSSSVFRMIISTILGLAAFIFLLVWWIKPFVFFEQIEEVTLLSQAAQYFSIILILNLCASLTHIERASSIFKRRQFQFLFLSSLFFLIPYIAIATYVVLFKIVNINILLYSSLSVFIGNLFFLVSSRRGFVAESMREDTAVNTSLTLFLVGGYLFFIGAFIKIFQVFGWNLNVLFSVITGIFLIVALFLLFFSSSVKERIRYSVMRTLTRQKYDWQKIWEDFTYKISLITELHQIEERLSESVRNITDAREVKVMIFGAQIPFEAGFCDWLLRKAEPFRVDDVFQNGFADRYPGALRYLEQREIEIVVPLFGDKQIVGIIGLSLGKKQFFDTELLRVLSLQASSVIVNCLAYQKIREAEKKESLYKLSSFIIHDVKNYVNNLSMLSANKDKFGNPEFQKDALFTLEHTIEKMTDLIEEFRALRGDLKLNLTRCALCDLTREVLRELGESRFKNIEVREECDPQCVVEVDPHYMNKVLANVILNAIEAMSSGGALTIKTESSEYSVLLSIQDNGCGIAQEFLDNQLFQPFQSTKEKGLGIGLYQCKTIIEAHGGSMRAESVLNEGTTFTITMPKAKEASPGSETRNAKRETRKEDQ